MTTSSHIDPEADLVYRALASPVRRRIMDLVRLSPGITVGGLAEGFEISRFAIRKHLQMLSEASLLTVEQDGTAKRHYLNPVPIQLIYDRWLSQYSARWASALTGLKYTLEQEDPTMSSLKHRYEVYIRSSAQKVWQAITDPAFTQQFYYGTCVHSSFEAGSQITYATPEAPDVAMIKGTIVECDPPNRLVHTFDFGKGDGASRVSYELEQMGETTKLTLVHDQFDSENDTYRGVGPGWNPILSGLKTLLETGEPLVIPMPQT